MATCCGLDEIWSLEPPYRKSKKEVKNFSNFFLYGTMESNERFPRIANNRVITYNFTTQYKHKQPNNLHGDTPHPTLTKKSRQHC